MTEPPPYGLHPTLIVIPTITARQEYLAECLKAYIETLGPIGEPYEYGFCVVLDKPTCGEGWNAGARQARKFGYKYVHMTADDLIPHPGWLDVAVETVEHEGNFLPGALVFDPDYSLPSHGNQVLPEWYPTGGASVPFLKTEDWIDIPDIHYWSDNAFDHAQREKNGKTFVTRSRYAFTHHTAQAGRKGLDTAERDTYEEWARNL